ncbi:MBL fold metallo-hydrolase [Kutzneria sp. NPDC052558]|uniref:MBL fold metallo-hydrolase n=1 Tax=Kutzneria sp. NPDC052558 TaxID=3364121 RepID=UPI0037CA299D
MTEHPGFTAFGDVRIAPVHEWQGALFTRADLLPESDRRDWEAQRSWLEPDFWAPESEDAWLTSQSFLIRSAGRTILLDTGIGNHKAGRGAPPFNGLDTAYLDNLATLGFRPEDIDLVINTHLHPDHTGWNTYLDDGRWRPTFPNATHLLPKADFDQLAEYAKAGATDPFGFVTAFQDSIAPVAEHGKVQLWDGDEHVIDDALRLVATPGHSAGACVLTVTSQGENALFAGDLVHHPMQILDPRQRDVLDADGAAATQSRLRLLTWACDNAAPVFGAHFPGARGAVVSSAGAAFRIDSWTSL